MPENILVVEYEPRYTDRVRQALAGQPFTAFFAKDGEEAMRSLDSDPPRLIVLSSVIPKISTSELIRAIRGRKSLSETPILLTVSGYNGKSPKQDAVRMGASDILPKPYSESEFLGKVHQMLGVRIEATSAPQWAPAELDGDYTLREAPAATVSGQQLTSSEIFGDLLDDDRTVTAGARKPMSKQKDDLDKMLADTLSGMRQTKRRDAPATPSPATPEGATPAAARPAPPPPPAVAAQKPAEAKPSRAQSDAHDLDKMLHDTLSGLEKTGRKASAPPPAPPAPQPAAAKPAVPPPSAPPSAPPPAAAATQRFNTARIPAYVADRVPVAQPVFPQAAPEPAKIEDDEPVDGIKFGQYLLVEKIATGGMAEVWKARMRGVEGFQKIVAIKKILPHLSDDQDFIEMFVDEAKLAAQLNHNNIIHIYDLGKIQSSYYIAMEYIDGYDLKTILRRGQERDQPIQVELALFIASKIAAALDYAHRKRDFEDRDIGLVHRDVSPQNVLISEEGDIKLCDFGIAKAASKASHTQAGALKGKLQYMSPEQAWGRNIDKRSDIFALATVLYEMLTGRKLFTGDNELSILEQVREARVATPSEYNDEVTPEVDAIVQKALQKDPANRYQTAGEMARDMDAILYSFKPTPTSADLAIYMHRIYAPEPAPLSEPVPESRPTSTPTPVSIVPPAPAPIASVPAAAPASTDSVASDDQPAPAAKKSPVALIAVAVVLLLAIGGVVYFIMSKRGAQQAATTPAATTTRSAAATGTIVPTATTASTSPTSTATSTAVDPSLVDQEVAKRIAAERARLEQQRTQQQAAATTPARPTPVPAAPTPAPVVTPPPVAETRPAPTPAAPAPTPVVEQPAPQPAPAAPAARAREGDLVPAGTEGLVVARLLRRGTVPYPPLAKVQHVEGTVVMSVLISETGQVLEVKVLRGINRPVGLNEAAEQAMRRSTFAPGTKDGVRVKTRITIPVEFKL